MVKEVQFQKSMRHTKISIFGHRMGRIFHKRNATGYQLNIDETFKEEINRCTNGGELFSDNVQMDGSRNATTDLSGAKVYKTDTDRGSSFH